MASSENEPAPPNDAFVSPPQQVSVRPLRRDAGLVVAYEEMLDLTEKLLDT